MKPIYTLCLCLLSWAIVKAQTTLTFTPSKDNTIFEISNTSSNGAGSSLFAGNDNANRKHRGLMRFDLSSIPTNATVTNVTLSLTLNKTNDGTAKTHSLNKVSADWGEGTSVGSGGGDAATPNDATWSDRFFGVSTWSSLGGDFSTTASSSTSIGGVGAYTFPSTAQLIADVQAWVLSASTNYGWILIGDESTSGTARRFNSRESGTVANRPTLSVTFTGAVPVTWVDFAAYTEGSKNKLTWTTATELNNKGFQIERSPQPAKGAFTAWDILGFVAPQPAKGAFAHYEFLDAAPPSGAGGTYYRLRQIDYDGTETLSKVVTVSSKGTKGSLKVYPTVVKDILNVVTEDKAAYQVFNLLGQQALSGQKPSSGVWGLDVSGLPQGTYIFKVGTEQAKFMKQ